jgi:hypothetical protein
MKAELKFAKSTLILVEIEPLLVLLQRGIHDKIKLDNNENFFSSNCLDVQTCTMSSQTTFVFFFLAMPFSRAYCCHLVKGLGLGQGFSLGSLVLPAGRGTTTISSLLSTGISHSLLSSNCVLSLAKLVRYSSLCFDLVPGNGEYKIIILF